MRFFKHDKPIAPGETVEVRLEPAPEAPEGESQFDMMREMLGLPPYWRDEWFMPGVAMPNDEEMKRIAAQWYATHK